ncbi:hypothetical protein ACP4OV_022857 [Aristida adscensionis]
MGHESRRRRRRRTKIAGVCEEGASEAPTTTIDDVADDLLGAVLLRVGSPVCVVRAAAACTRWRRVIAGDESFLRLFGRVHILGHYHVMEPDGGTLFVPATTPPGAPRIYVGDRVSLDFLAGGQRRRYQPALTDSRGGLLAAVRSDAAVVVCNPWTRQHREIYPARPKPGEAFSPWLGAFFLDADADETCTGPSMSNFRVLFARLAHEPNQTTTGRASVFSARDGACRSWRSPVAGNVVVPEGAPPPAAAAIGIHAHFEFVGRAGGSLCWSAEGGSVLHLDESSFKFSRLTLPRRRTSTAAAARPRRLDVLTWARGSGECVVERTVCLSQLAGLDAGRDWPWRFLDVAAAAAPPHERVMLLPDEDHMAMFSFDTGSIAMGPAQKRTWRAWRVFPYELPWPPTLKACIKG